MGITEVVRAPETSPANRVNLGGIARDVATLGSGTLLATVFNILLVFLIPRLVSVENYGYWRIFLLYSVYAGFLHLGLADGALLRWGGRPFEDFHHEILPSLKFLFVQHSVILLPAAFAVMMLFRRELRFVGIAVLAFILLINLITLLQFGLQSSRNFAPVAISSAGPVGMFLALVFLCEFWRVPDFRVLILLYFAAWSATLGYLLATVKPTSAANVGDSTWKLGKDHIALGWPVLLAGNGLVLVQSVDRLVVSWEASIQGFAMYSLAASATVTIALALIVAAFRVFFPHLAALERQQHREVYATASRLLFLCWALILPYYFVLEAFVKRALPQYSGSLPVACILLGGTVFLGEIQFLHASFAYVYGRQRTFLWYTLAALVLTFLIAVGAAFGTHSLRIVAAGEVVALGLWWMFDEWQLRELTGQTPKEWLALLGLFCWALVSYWVALHQFHSGPARMAVYYGMVAGALWLVCSAELRLILKFLTFARSRVLQAV